MPEAIRCTVMRYLQKYTIKVTSVKFSQYRCSFISGFCQEMSPLWKQAITLRVGGFGFNSQWGRNYLLPSTLLSDGI
jgi:hypothetical protein